jgi:hypothetical protein
VDANLPADIGPLDPGLSELFQTLTSGPRPGELAGEQAALAMFRENQSPAAALSPGRFSRARRRTSRLSGAPGRWGMRLTAAAAVVLSGGFAAAAYAAVLPAPVQHAAYRVLGFAGVPDTHHHHHHAGSAPPGQNQAGGPGGPSRSSAPAGRSPSAGASPRGSASATTPASTAAASPSSSAAAAPDRLSASVADAQIVAGSSLTISGRLTTAAGAGVPGTTVRLLRRGRPGIWRQAGTGQTDANGNVAVLDPLLGGNAVFELAGPDGVASPAVVITVLPPVDAELSVGAKGLHDVLVVSTQYAHRGNLVVLQRELADGSWVTVREQRLNAAGKTRFLVSGRNLKNDQIRVVLSATPRHGESASNPVTVPPPVS